MSASEVSGGMTLAKIAPNTRAFDALISARVDEVLTPLQPEAPQPHVNGTLWFNRRVASHLIDRALSGDIDRMTKGLQVIETHNPLMALNVRFLGLRSLEAATVSSSGPSHALEHEVDTAAELRRSQVHDILLQGTIGQLVRDMFTEKDPKLSTYDYLQFFVPDGDTSPFSITTQRTIANGLRAKPGLYPKVERFLKTYFSSVVNREHTMEDRVTIEPDEEGSGGIGTADVTHIETERHVDTEALLYELRSWLTPDEVESIRLGVHDDSLSLTIVQRLWVMAESGLTEEVYALRDVMAEKNLFSDDHALSANEMHDIVLRDEVGELIRNAQYDIALAIMREHPSYTEETREVMTRFIDHALKNGGKVPDDHSPATLKEPPNWIEIDRQFKGIVAGIEIEDEIVAFHAKISSLESPDAARKLLEENVSPSRVDLVNAYNNAITQQILTQINIGQFEAAQQWFNARFRHEQEPSFDELHDAILDAYVRATSTKDFQALVQRADPETTGARLDALYHWYAAAHLESESGQQIRKRTLALIQRQIDNVVFFTLTPLPEDDRSE